MCIYTILKVRDFYPFQGSEFGATGNPEAFTVSRRWCDNGQNFCQGEGCDFSPVLKKPADASAFSVERIRTGQSG
jgi:hypothetical protein